jgi:dCMP deaminase
MNKWHNRFLELAKHVSSWSKDTTQVGAVIVEPYTKKVVGLGYNGFPRGVNDDPSRYTDRDTKLKFVCHAELNAILNANGPVAGCDIYVYPTMMNPASCPECSKAIVQSGIKTLYYYKNNNVNSKWKELEMFSETILKEGRVHCIEVENEQ